MRGAFPVIEGIVLTVGEAEIGLRLDLFLRSRLASLPPRSVRFAIESGEVRVGGLRGRKGQTLSGGETVTVRRIAEPRDWMPVPCDLPGASVLYEDGVVAVLDKPAGVHTEPQRPIETGTLAGYLRWEFPFVAEIAATPGLTLLARLDRDTSGAVPAALTPEAMVALSRERERGNLRKRYYCLVHGRVDKEMTLWPPIDDAGGRSVRVKTGERDPDPGRWTIVSPVRPGDSVSLVCAEISRGRRHQIRAHLASAGFPVVGDRRYLAISPSEPSPGRLMLHAAEVTFPHPRERERITVRSPLPESFGSI